MDHVLEAIHTLHNSQARHKRKGFKYGSRTTQDMLKHAAEELIELAAADAFTFDHEGKNAWMEEVEKELGDLMSILLHFAYMKGFTKDSLQIQMIDKLLLRFKMPPRERARLRELSNQLKSRKPIKRLYGS